MVGGYTPPDALQKSVFVHRPGKTMGGIECAHGLVHAVATSKSQLSSKIGDGSAEVVAVCALCLCAVAVQHTEKAGSNNKRPFWNFSLIVYSIHLHYTVVYSTCIGIRASRLVCADLLHALRRLV